MSCRTDSRVECQLLDAEAPAQGRARPSRPAGAAGGRLGCAGGLGLRNEGSGRTRPAAEALPRVKLIALASRQHACRRPAVALHRFQVRCPARRRRSVTSESEQKTLKFLFGHQQQIGRASCRERVCQYVSISGVAVSSKQKENKTTTN